MSPNAARLLPLVALLGCGGPMSTLEDGEWLPGGETTSTLLLGSNAFLMPAQNLSPEHEQDFYSGNSFFNASWTEAPASAEARDGLGPLFNARSCSGCHFKDGKAAPPEAGDGPFVGLLLRLSVPGADGPVPDPIYGGQLQDQANPDVPVELTPSVTWHDQEGRFDDGAAYSLTWPTFTVSDAQHGAVGDGLMMSPRVAPHMVGLGLLEAIPEEALLALADPNDDDGDGISGRVQRHDGRVGRFGWKADAVDVEAQVAGAFAGDMGLTSRVVPLDDCTEAQAECLAEPSGGDPEVSDQILDLVTLYSRAVAVPARRAADDETVLVGKALFNDIGCAACHTPSHTTGASPLPELQDQRIWPYTDLLLHDMGEGLADGRPLGDASGQEWRTPPLWSLGLIDEVNGHTRFLHDGRARSLEEAILWHGGEAAAAQAEFVALSADEREALIVFLEDL
ncbi:MAG: c-type cytochrome [Deltaproteobacteria bacterium]|nr:c-type cytochrome [Deltaproteobacteria bacterium]